MDTADNPFAVGLPENLKPNPAPPMPEAPGPGDAMASLSPFKEALDVEKIMENLVLDRPLKLYIPNLDKYVGYEFRIINNVPQEIADAHNKGFRKVDNPDLAGLFTDLVAGTDKVGRAYGLMLFSRPKAIGDHVRQQKRKQLAAIYQGMDPANKDMSGKYTENVDRNAGTKANFSGPTFRIR